NGVCLKEYSKKRFEFTGIVDERGAIEASRNLVETSVKRRLLSDVPLGCFLSSGLDSSIIATIAAKELDELSTYTIGFEDVDDPYHGKADESKMVEEYVRKLGTKHRTIRVTADDFKNNLELFTCHGDQPFAVSSGLGILSVAEAAKQDGIKVLLSGDGADEAFGGYSWYQHLNKMNGFRADLSQSNNGHYSMQYVNMPLRELLKRLESYSPSDRAWAWHYYASEKDKAELFSVEPFAEIESSHSHFHSYKNGNDWTPEEYIHQDRLFYFPNEMLRKMDRMTMAHSVEGRVPFAAPSILSFADRLNYGQMVRGKTLKWTLRQAFKDILPFEVVHRPKHGFNVPIDHWLKGRWSEMVDEAFAPSSALSRMKLIRKGSWARAKQMLNDPVRLTGHTIFCYIQLNRWLEQTESVMV
ncbi:asparagine synthetase B family protein, partial [Calditrichota bacterium]